MKGMRVYRDAAAADFWGLMSHAADSCLQLGEKEQAPQIITKTWEIKERKTEANSDWKKIPTRTSGDTVDKVTAMMEGGTVGFRYLLDELSEKTYKSSWQVKLAQGKLSMTGSGHLCRCAMPSLIK